MTTQQTPFPCNVPVTLSDGRHFTVCFHEDGTPGRVQQNNTGPSRGGFRKLAQGTTLYDRVVDAARSALAPADLACSVLEINVVNCRGTCRTERVDVSTDAGAQRIAQRARTTDRATLARWREQLSGYRWPNATNVARVRAAIERFL